ncbi:MAG: transposase [Actinomycetota bacterium]|nr:transposase [Actinomycetota bacterium]
MERTETTEKKLTTPSTEVLEKPVRRRFTAQYKLRILAETDGCTEMGQIGELLRREGLYSSQLSTWRKQRQQGVLAGLAPKRRGRKPKTKNPLAHEVAKLQRENQRLKNNLRKAELVIDVQKKVSEMLDIPLTPRDSEGTN